MWQRITTWWRRSLSLNRATQGENPEALVAFLGDHPEEADRLAEVALRLCTDYAVWHSLLVSVALAASDSPHATRVVEKLVANNEDEIRRKKVPVPWHRLSSSQLKTLGEFLGGQGETDLCDRLLGQLDGDQLLSLAPAIGSQRFLQWAQHYLQGQRPVDALTKGLADHVEAVAFGPYSNGGEPQSTDVDLRNCLEVARAIWDAGHVEQAIEICHLLAIAQPGLLGQDTAAHVVRDIRKCNGISLIRAVNLLRRFPSAESVPCLKDLWVRIVRLTRKDEDEHGQRKLSPESAALANATAAALGTCAACDCDYTALETGAGASADLKKAIEERTALVGQHRELVQEFHACEAMSDRERIAERINAVQDEVRRKDDEIKEMEDEHLFALSPGVLLLFALTDDQNYAGEVRQGAAWGLHKLRESGHLDEGFREKILEAINSASREFDPEELREQLNERLPPDEGLRQEVFEAAVAYMHGLNEAKLVGVLEALPVDDADRSHLAGAIRLRARSGPVRDFQERCVRFLPGQRKLELEQELRDGLAWMGEIGDEPDEPGGLSLRDLDYPHLRRIVHLLHEHVPNALRFLSRYPLRLMTLRQHSRLLGRYSKTGSDVTLWTRYSPPLWRRGARPEEVGVVHSRFLSLDDRSVPNAMGICCRLFRHPILALPVIYHESLHYGGTAGEPDAGIENETEVLLREIIFARGLIATLAPQDDAKIPEFETELIHGTHAAHLDGLLAQLRYDLRDDDILEEICQEVELTYGKRLAREQAKTEAQRIIKMENSHIHLQNLTNEMKRNWCPEIEWPFLGDAAKDLTAEYRRILITVLTSDRRIGPRQRDRVLADPLCQSSIRAWDAYCARPGALDGFRPAWVAIPLEEAIASLVRRLRSGSVPEEVSRFGVPSALLEFLSRLASNDDGPGDAGNL